MIRQKFETLIWYLKRPSLYRELGRQSINAGKAIWQRETVDEVGAQGLEWCKQNKEEEISFFETLGLQTNLSASPKILSLSESHPDVWKAAHAVVDSCPVKMGGPANVDLIYQLVLELPALRVVETGVASGWSSLAVLAAMDDLGRGELVSTDRPYPRSDNDPWVGHAVPDSLRHRWTLLRLPDRDSLPNAIKKLATLDLAHHDSDKSYDGRMYVYKTCWPALRIGGVLLSDDIEENLAFRDFSACVNRTPHVFSKKPGNYCGALIK